MKDRIQVLTDYIHQAPISSMSQLQILQFDPGILKTSVHLVDLFRRQDGIAHGGFLSYYSDSLMGFAALSLVLDTQTVFTVELKMSFLRPATSSLLHGKAHVLKAGKSLHFCESEIYTLDENQNKHLFAKSSATMAVVQKK